MEYKIISDGCCDLTAEVIDKHQLHVIPFYISFDGVNYVKEIQEIGIREVYERMVGQPDVIPKTSLPSMQDYIDAFTSYVEKGIGVVCICFTPSLSGSYNCACNARDIVLEDYPDAKLTVINSEAGTVSQEVMVLEAARMREDGIPYEECVRILEEMKKTNHIFFTVGNVDYLVHGGRIGKVAAVATGVLSLKPIIVLENGEITAAGIGRSRKKTMDKTISTMEKYFKTSGEKMDDYAFSVGFGYDVEEGHAFYEKVKDFIVKNSKIRKVNLTQIGATIAVHTGPHAIGIGCIKRYECYL